MMMMQQIRRVQRTLAPWRYLPWVLLLFFVGCATIQEGVQTRMRYEGMTVRHARNAEGMPGVYIAAGSGLSYAAAIRNTTTSAARITELLGWRYFVVHDDVQVSMLGESMFTFHIVPEPAKGAIDATKWLDEWTNTKRPEAN